MKLPFIFSTLLCLMMDTAMAQGPEIPIPDDLKNERVKIISKTRVGGTTFIRYRYGGTLVTRLIYSNGEFREEPPIMSSVTAKGTGRTTGHIATLSVANPHDYSLRTVPQTFFIPSTGQYQSYVARIPEGIIIPPNGTTDVPVDGFCTDVHTPPVPSGTDMPPIDNWIPVGVPDEMISLDTVPQIPEELNPPTSTGPPPGDWPVILITNTPEPPFTPTDIPDIITSPGYNPGPGPGGDIIVTWPGTDTPVDGVFNPGEDPGSFARVIVDVLERVEEAAGTVQGSGSFPTPFTPDPPRETESWVQQVIWIYSAIVTGDDYNEEDFRDNVYDQFKDNTGTPVTSLPDEKKDDLDSGIADFWNSFQAVGVEAKVISVESPGLDMTDPEMNELIRAQTRPQCACDTMTYNIKYEFGGLPVQLKKDTITNYSATSRPEVEIDSAKFVAGFKIMISDIKVKCGACGEEPCEPFAREKEGGTDKRVDARKNQVRISEIKVTGGETPQEETKSKMGKGFDVNIKPSENVKNVRLSFQTSTTCMAADCRLKLCIANVSLNIVLLTEKVKEERRKKAEAEERRRRD